MHTKQTHSHKHTYLQIHKVITTPKQHTHTLHLLCLVFVMSSICYVKGLLCLLLVCLWFACLRPVDYGTIILSIKVNDSGKHIDITPLPTIQEWHTQLTVYTLQTIKQTTTDKDIQTCLQTQHNNRYTHTHTLTHKHNTYLQVCIKCTYNHKKTCIKGHNFNNFKGWT